MKLRFLILDLSVIIFYTYMFFSRKNDEYRIVLPFVCLVLMEFLYRKYKLFIKSNFMKLISVKKIEIFNTLIMIYVYLFILKTIMYNTEYNFLFIYLIFSYIFMKSYVLYDEDILIYNNKVIKLSKINSIYINVKNKRLLEIKEENSNDIIKLNFISKELLDSSKKIIEYKMNGE